MSILPINGQAKSDDNRPARRQAAHDIAIVRNRLPATTVVPASDRNQSLAYTPLTTQLATLKSHYALESTNSADQKILAQVQVIRERRRGSEGKKTLIVFPAIVNMSPQLFSQIIALRKQPLLRVVLPDGFLTTGRMQTSVAPSVSNGLTYTSKRRVVPRHNRYRKRQERIARLAAIVTLVLGLFTVIFTTQTAP